MAKPSLFIGSSTEGLEFARALRSLLVHDAEVTLWNEGFFSLGNTFIETLVNSLPRFDFAVLVMTPDDLVNSRNFESLGPRDNVLFELGLFMGRLGRWRTFVLHQSNSTLKIPSDLSGMTTATYEWPREDNSCKSSVGPASDSIREAIRNLGISDTKTARDISGIRSRQDELQITSTPSSPVVFDPAAVLTDPDVHSLLGRMKSVVGKKRARSKIVRICNLALDMESTWTYIRDKYLDDRTITDIEWRSLMIDPTSAAIKALQSHTVSTATATEKIQRMQEFFPKEHANLEGRRIHVKVRAYDSVPIMHGFLVDDDVLFLSFCGIRQVPATDNPAISVNELIGSPNAYWQFEKQSADSASGYFISAFASWFEFLWKTGRHIWPAD